MNLLLPLLYFTLFAVIAGGAFAMMWANVQSINEEMRRPRKPQHPEAPKEGDELLYVDLTKENWKSYTRTLKKSRQKFYSTGFTYK
jgi:hypothetical protein